MSSQNELPIFVFYMKMGPNPWRGLFLLCSSEVSSTRLNFQRWGLDHKLDGLEWISVYHLYKIRFENQMILLKKAFVDHIGPVSNVRNVVFGFRLANGMLVPFLDHDLIFGSNSNSIYFGLIYIIISFFFLFFWWNFPIYISWIALEVFKLMNGSFSFILSFVYVQSIYRG